jgi:flagellar basal-body rod protein FlgB
VGLLDVYFTATELDVSAREPVAPPVLNRRQVVDPIFQSQNYQLARKLLDATALRHEAIAANVANAETPGFRRMDLAPDFAVQLKAQFTSGGSLDRLASLQPKLAEDGSARSVRPDGNSVEIERELLALNRNTTEYHYLGEIISSNLKQLKMAITGRVG